MNKRINVPLTEKAIDILVALCESKREEAVEVGNNKTIAAIEDVIEQLESAEQAASQ